jgi:hypothetical protein
MLKVLIPVDGSDNSLRVVRHVIDKAALYKDPVEIHLLNVQRPFPGTIRGVKEQAEQYHRDEGDKALAGVRKLLDDAGLKYTCHISVGDAAEVIASYCHDRKARPDHHGHARRRRRREHADGLGRIQGPASRRRAGFAGQVSGAPTAKSGIN